MNIMWAGPVEIFLILVVVAFIAYMWCGGWWFAHAAE